MAATDDGQAAGIVNGKVDAANVGAGGVTGPGTRDAATVTFVTATAKVVNAVNDTYLYINITTAAALAIAMGPTSAAATVISVSQSSALGVVTLFVPAGWYVKLTGTMANVTCTSIEA